MAGRGARTAPLGPAAATSTSSAAIAAAAVHIERMTREHPGLDFTRADALRSLLTRALDQIEGPSAPTKRGGR